MRIWWNIFSNMLLYQLLLGMYLSMYTFLEEYQYHFLFIEVGKSYKCFPN